ncbi:hypothetical protein EH221_07070 [bacterium]|nr:MAG: hypothetical protein EH221_07070 [bacterium]
MEKYDNEYMQIVRRDFRDNWIQLKNGYRIHIVPPEYDGDIIYPTKKPIQCEICRREVEPHYEGKSLEVVTCKDMKDAMRGRLFPQVHNQGDIIDVINTCCQIISNVFKGKMIDGPGGGGG